MDCIVKVTMSQSGENCIFTHRFYTYLQVCSFVNNREQSRNRFVVSVRHVSRSEVPFYKGTISVSYEDLDSSMQREGTVPLTSLVHQSRQILAYIHSLYPGRWAGVCQKRKVQLPQLTKRSCRRRIYLDISFDNSSQ